MVTSIMLFTNEPYFTYKNTKAKLNTGMQVF